MAKTKWTDKDNILTVTMPDTGLSADFDMTLLYADYAKLREVVQTALMYGIKQKLSDCIARGTLEKLTDQEAVDTMTVRYKDICAGNWNMKGVTRGANPLKAMKEDATPEELKIIEGLEKKVLAKMKADKEAKAKEEVKINLTK